MRIRYTRFLSWTLILCLIIPLFLIHPIKVDAMETADRSIQDGVTLHCWNWSYEQIESNMEIIAQLGYTAIQTSPIQQAKQATAGYPSNDWWVFYQPAGFHIDDSGNSALGNKAEFESMCKSAHEYGIKVIVDVVANHMGNTESGTNGLASTIIQDLRGDTSCWHDIKKNTANYSDRFEVTQYCMAGLPDLNTANKKVQNYVLDYLKECIDSGADGFRFDAAKHIETPEDGSLASDFLPTVINGATAYAKDTRGIDLYCYGELLDDLGGNLSISAYTKYMQVTDNIWSANALSAVTYGTAGAFYPSYRKSEDASELVLWAESHDTYADGTTTAISDTNINKTWALIASRADAMSLYLARPANMSQLLGAASYTAWAYPEVAAVNQFHNRFAGESEYVANEGNYVYVERGNSGVVIVNCNGADAEVSITAHTIADGTYVDQITGNTFRVENGKINGTIGSTGIAVVSTGEVCAHEEHNAEGFCVMCLAMVGHSYNDQSICACGDKLVAMRTVYFVNTAKWSSVNFYSWYDGINIVTGAWPGDPMTRGEGDLYQCEIPADVPNIIFNNGSGVQTEDLTVPGESSGLNMYDYATGKWSTYEQDTVKPDSEPSVEQEETTATEPTKPDATVGETPAKKSPMLWIVIGLISVDVITAAVLIIKKK